MLPLSNRLKQDRDFRRVFKFGRSFYSRNLQLKLAQNQAGESRFGFVIGLNVSKKSTVRNRLKRQVREAVRLLYKNSLIKPNFDVVIKIKASLIGAEYKDIKGEVEYLLNKAGVLNEKLRGTPISFLQSQRQSAAKKRYRRTPNICNI